MKRFLVLLEVWGEFPELGWAQGLAACPCSVLSSRNPPASSQEGNREGSRAGRALWLAGVANEVRNGFCIRRRHGGCHPLCARLAAGKRLGRVPCQLWLAFPMGSRGISSSEVYPSLSALAGLWPGWNNKRWIVVCREEALKAPS